MTHPSSLVIDALASGRLGDAEAAAARVHVASCDRCRADLATVETAFATFTREVFPRTVGTLRPRRSPWRFVLPTLVPVLAVALLVIWQVRRDPAVPVADDDIRIKGALTFQVFANRGDEVIPVRDGTTLAAGDKIRFVVGSGGPGYLLVVSIDGAGASTVYYPYGGARSGPVTKEPSELPGSIVLDAAPGPERVFALVSPEPLEAAVVKRALATIGARGRDAIRETHALEITAQQATLVFEKAAP
ncbi:MAG: hypothetical protein ABI867_36755 [Kofleriaceae bacterium]